MIINVNSYKMRESLAQCKAKYITTHACTLPACVIARLCRLSQLQSILHLSWFQQSHTTETPTPTCSCKGYLQIF